MTPFDIAQAPLAGVNLIEAGAGTGKTYTIAGLYARLVAELGLTVDQILVVTYTKAATEELKGRIRKKLNDVRAALTGGPADALLTALAARTERERIRSRVQAALIDFDRAAIFTIHGFCQRVLQHFAFETGQLFRTELIQDQSGLLQEAADDFWRRNVCSAPAELASYVLQKLKGPEQLAEEFNRCRYPYVRILPDQRKPRLSAIREWRRVAREMHAQWPAVRSMVIDLLDTPDLNGKFYGVCAQDPSTGVSPRRACLDMLAASLDRWNGRYPLPPGAEHWGLAFLIKATRKKRSTPRHPFFDLCQEAVDVQARLEGQLAHYVRYLKVRFLRQARDRLGRKKQDRQVLHFDDLLLQLHRATLIEGRGDALAEAVRSQYRGVLVDEFQDTDPLQYEIFTRLFNGGQPLLFMIGDPKQAIYSFRGADVYAYLRAARDVPTAYTLTRNFRSAPELIRAVNTVFGRREKPFGIGRINYEAAVPAEQAVDSGTPGMVLWHLPLSAEPVVTPPMSRQAAVDTISSAVAGEIARLLNDPENPLAAESIAVLTRSHRQAQQVKKALDGVNVPAVLHSAGNVFDTSEAGQLRFLLQAVLEPSDAVRVRTALSTDLLGVRAADLVDPSGEEIPAAWERRWMRFGEYHREWVAHGFYRMFSRLVREEGVKARLLALDSGERRVTNLLHLAELLHQAESQQRLGPEGLVKWFARQNGSGAAGDEARELRLESDAHAVQIITMHRSKGLQFEIVFCPFTWTGVREESQAAVFHDPQADQQLTLAIGPDLPERCRLQMLKETLSENLRMLYVALTRARRRCYWVWGRIRNCEVSAPAYLLHGPEVDLNGDWYGTFKMRVSTLTDRAMRDDLTALAAASEGAIRLESLPAGTAARACTAGAPETELHCRTFRTPIREPWRMVSFSSLTSGAHAAAVEIPDRDQDAEPESSEDGVDFSSLFDFPGGVRAGLFFHDLLEHAGFGDPVVEGYAQLVDRKLKAYGYDPAWGAAILRMLATLVTRELPGLHGGSLARVDARQRINEMEFYVPLKRIDATRLSAQFAGLIPDTLRECRQALERLTFAPVEGYLKGFIDMVFQEGGRYYLVDWKSNRLGRGREAYAPQNLGPVMTDSYYFLQYHLYAVALDQLLRCRKQDYVYERHFGGVYYVFLRGLETAGQGIFHDRPDGNLIGRLREALIDSSTT